MCKYYMAKRPPLELIPEAEFIHQTEVTQESSDTGHVTVNVLSVQPSKPPQKRKSRKLQEFDRDMDQALPDFARILAKVYRGLDELVDLARDDSKQMMELKQVESRMRILSGVAKMLPLAQQAEQNHRAKVNDVELEQLTTEQLRALIGAPDADVDNEI